MTTIKIDLTIPGAPNVSELGELPATACPSNLKCPGIWREMAPGGGWRLDKAGETIATVQRYHGETWTWRIASASYTDHEKWQCVEPLGSLEDARAEVEQRIVDAREGSRRVAQVLEASARALGMLCEDPAKDRPASAAALMVVNRLAELLPAHHAPAEMLERELSALRNRLWGMDS